MLFDVTKDGKTIPAVAAMNKSGYLFIPQPPDRQAAV